MEEGSLRCDANVSLRPVGTEAFGTKVEIKNMNSIRSLERALVYEIERQTKALEAGEPIVQETRHWDEDAGATKSMRSKEEAFDYRYFPEPDIPALEPDPAWIEEIRASLPELPRARRERYVGELGLKPEVARVLVARPRLRRAVRGRARRRRRSGAPPRTGSPRTSAALRNAAGDDGALTPAHVADVVRLIADGTVSNAGAKQALEASFATGEPVAEAVARLGLTQVSDTGALGALADEVIAENPDVVAEVPRRQGGRDRLPGRTADAEGGRRGQPEARPGAPARAAPGVAPRGDRAGAADRAYPRADAALAAGAARRAFARSRGSSRTRCSGCGAATIRSTPTG